MDGTNYSVWKYISYVEKNSVFRNNTKYTDRSLISLFVQRLRKWLIMSRRSHRDMYFYFLKFIAKFKSRCKTGSYTLSRGHMLHVSELLALVVDSKVTLSTIFRYKHCLFLNALFLKVDFHTFKTIAKTTVEFFVDFYAVLGLIYVRRAYKDPKSSMKTQKFH